MARRGTPIPFAVRQEIKRLRYQLRLDVRSIAAMLGVNKDTVSKYAPSFGQPPQQTEPNRV